MASTIRSSARTGSRRASPARPRAARGAPSRAPRRARRRTPGRAGRPAAAASPPRRRGTNESIWNDGDQAVATEEGGEPGHAGGVVGVTVELRVEQVQVVQRALEDPVEELVVGGHPGAAVVAVARGACRRPRRWCSRRPRSPPPGRSLPRASRSRSNTSEPSSRTRGSGVARTRVARRTPSRPTSEKPSGPASGGGRSCLGTIPRSSSIGRKSAPRRSSSESRIGCR